jgi:polycomb protein EED
VKEDHGKVIYCVAFSKLLPTFFATVGANRLSIYESKPNGVIELVQVYADEDTEEVYFTCAWSFIAAEDQTPVPVVATGGSRGVIKVIDVTAQQLAKTLTGHGNAVNELCFHTVDPFLLLSASKDETVRLWNVRTECCIAVFTGDRGHRDEVLSIDVHLLGNCFLSSGMDNTVKIWSLDSMELAAAIDASHVREGVAAGAGAGSGGSAAATSAVAAPRTRPIFIQYPAFSTRRVHGDYVDCVRWLGNAVLSKSTHNKICLWKPCPRRRKDAVTLLRQFTLPDTDIWFVRFSLDEDKALVAAGNTLGRVYVYDPHDLPDVPTALPDGDTGASAGAARSAEDVGALPIAPITHTLGTSRSSSPAQLSGGSSSSSSSGGGGGDSARSSSAKRKHSTAAEAKGGVVYKAACSVSHPHSRPTVRDTAFSPDGRSMIFVCDDSTVVRCDFPASRRAAASQSGY